MERYIYQQNNWTHFSWDGKTISPLLGEVRNLKGRLIGKMNAFGFSLQKEAVLNTLTVEALKTSEIALQQKSCGICTVYFHTVP